MPGRRIVLPSAMFALVLIAALSAQAIRTTHAADDCLAKPNAATPSGQHWYYRIDHANNNRQCWRLAPEGLPVQKTAPQSEETTASEPDPPQQLRAPQAANAAPARAAADAAPVAPANSAAIVPPVPVPVPWPEAAKSPVLPQAQAEPQTASAEGTLPVTMSSDSSATADDPAPTGSVRAERPQRPAAERLPPSAAPPQQFAAIDHTFALLMVMFALLGVTGPILHFTHRQRQREVINYKPPRWAPVIPLNTPAPRVRITHTPDPAIAYRPARRAAPRAGQPDWRPAAHPSPSLDPRMDPRINSNLDSRPAPRPVPIPAHPPDPERAVEACPATTGRPNTNHPKT